MAEREPLFRREAVEYQKKKASAADLVRLSVGWAKAGFWLVLAAVIAIVAAASIARVETVVLASAMVEDGAVTAVMGAGQGAAPAEGSTAKYLPADGTAEHEVRLEAVEENVPADEARAQFPALAMAITGPVTVVRTSDVDDAPSFGHLRVKTGSEPLIVAFVPGLRELFGEP